MRKLKEIVGKKTAEILSWCRKYCPPKTFVHQKFYVRNTMMRLKVSKMKHHLRINFTTTTPQRFSSVAHFPVFLFKCFVKLFFRLCCFEFRILNILSLFEFTYSELTRDFPFTKCKLKLPFAK